MRTWWTVGLSNTQPHEEEIYCSTLVVQKPAIHRRGPVGLLDDHHATNSDFRQRQTEALSLITIAADEADRAVRPVPFSTYGTDDE